MVSHERRDDQGLLTMIPLPKNFANSNTTPGTRRRSHDTRLDTIGNSVPIKEVARMIKRAAKGRKKHEGRAKEKSASASG